MDLLRSSWAFMRKQPALRSVTLWLIFFPVLASAALSRHLESARDSWQGANDAGPVLLLSLGLILTGIVLIWGQASVLIVGKRMLQHKAGRSRTSFKAAARQARAYLIPLILTGILRACFTALWALLLIVPGILYSLSTVLYPVVVIAERRAYRKALRRCREVLHGQWVHGVWSIIVLSVLTFGPAYILSALLSLADTGSPIIALLVDTASAAAESLAMLLFTLGSIQLYGQLRKKGKLEALEEGVAEE